MLDDSITNLRLGVLSSLSQDVISTAHVLVSSTSSSPVAVFANPTHSWDGAGAEALCILDLSDDGQGREQVCHVRRSSESEAGWVVDPLFQGREAHLVAAGTAYAGTTDERVHAVFAADDGVHAATLGADGKSWTTPQQVTSLAAGSLRTAYAPDGMLVFYGSTTSGNLVTLYQPKVGGPFEATECKMDGALMGHDFRLCMLDAVNWQIMANNDGAPLLVTGELGAVEPASSAPVSGFTGKVAGIALGYWNLQQNTLVYLLTDADGALHVWSSNRTSAQPTVRLIGGAKVAAASGHVAADGRLQVYFTDADGGLFVLNQSARMPWSFEGMPNWAPVIPLDKGVGSVFSDAVPAHAPSLFVLDAATNALAFHVQNATTRMWRSGPVLQASARAFELARYRTEISVQDSVGMMAPGRTIRLRVAKGSGAADITVGNTTLHVTEEAPVTLTSDAMGKVTFSVLVHQGLGVAQFEILNDDATAAALTINPAQDVHAYLSGKGELNPGNPGGALPVFDADGKALATAQVRGGTLAPRAASDPALASMTAQAIRKTSAIGLGHASAADSFAVSFSGPNPRLVSLPDNDAIAAHAQFLFGEAVAPEGLWDDISHFFGDIWQGIKNGAIAIADALVDVGKGIVTLTARIGDWLAKGVTLALDGLEKAAQFVAGVFAAVGAAVRKAIDWLKALFDFGAIWRTKMALEQALLAAPPYIARVADFGRKAADGWFAAQKAQVDAAFETYRQQNAGRKMSGTPGWQNHGDGPSDKPIGGTGFAPAGATQSVHGNWLNDKMSAHAGDTMPADPNDPTAAAWAAFFEHGKEGMQEFSSALDHFGKAMADLIRHPDKFQEMALPEFVDMLNDLVDGLLDTADAIVDLLAALAETAMEGLEALLSKELDLGFLNTLWSWVADAAGHPEDDRLTFGALLSLMAAFPATIIYKLIEGTDREPFPNGVFPGLPRSETAIFAGQGAMGPMGVVMPRATRIMSAVLQMLAFIPSLASTLLGNECPWWLSAGSLGLAVLIWVLANGYPDLNAVEWIGIGVVLMQLSWIVPVIYFQIQQLNATQREKMSVVMSDTVAVLTSLYGFGMLALGIYKDVELDQSVPIEAANILSPMSSMFAFLDMSAARNEYTIAALAFFVALGNLGGGAMQLVDILENGEA